MRGSVQQMRLRHFKHLNKECPWNSRTATKWSRRELLSCVTQRIPKICLNFESILPQVIWKFWKVRLFDSVWWKRYSGGRTRDFAAGVHVKSFGNSALGEAVGQYATAITAWSGCKRETPGVKGSRDSATSKGERFLFPRTVKLKFCLFIISTISCLCLQWNWAILLGDAKETSRRPIFATAYLPILMIKDMCSEFCCLADESLFRRGSLWTS